MDNAEIMYKLLSIPGIIIGFAFHEFAHALAADRLGDSTPREQGRLTLDPVSHIDIIGLLLIILAGFGWAKPVQVNLRNFKSPRRDHIIVSLSGPVMNFIVALLFGIVMKLLLVSGVLNNINETVANGIIGIFSIGVSVNVMLFLFNLIPIYPLDGFQILSEIVPYNKRQNIYKLYKYSRIILIIIIMTPIASYVLSPIIGSICDGIFALLRI